MDQKTSTPIKIEIKVHQAQADLDQLPAVYSKQLSFDSADLILPEALYHGTSECIADLLSKEKPSGDDMKVYFYDHVRRAYLVGFGQFEAMICKSDFESLYPVPKNEEFVWPRMDYVEVLRDFTRGDIVNVLSTTHGKHRQCMLTSVQRTHLSYIDRHKARFVVKKRDLIRVDMVYSGDIEKLKKAEAKEAEASQATT